MPYRFEPRVAFDARVAIHVALTANLAWLGFVLVMPAETFATDRTWRLFQIIASEDLWALMMFAGAVAGAVGIDTAHRWLKISSILLLSSAHGSLALLFLFGDPVGRSGGTYAIMAMLGYYLAYRQVRRSGS